MIAGERVALRMGVSSSGSLVIVRLLPKHEIPLPLNRFNQKLPSKRTGNDIDNMIRWNEEYFAGVPIDQIEPFG